MLSVTHYFLAALLVAGFAPQNTCAKCPQNCSNCAGEPAGQCSDGWCDSGYGQTPQGTCAKCPQNCDECDSKDVPAGQCSQCAVGYRRSPQNTCTVKCPQNCFNCDYKDLPAGKCDWCNDGYGVTPQKTCAKCPQNCNGCDSEDVPAGQCKWCFYGSDLTPQNTCIKDCTRFNCCYYDCPKAKAGTCSQEYGNFNFLKPIKIISWKTTAKRLTVGTCQAACLRNPSCFGYHFSGTQNCKGSRPCPSCPCTTLGQHQGDCSLYGADAKDQVQLQSPYGTGYRFYQRLGGYCWH